VVTDDDGYAIGYKVLPRGTPVRSSDGEQIGTVRRVQDNTREHIFDGIVIDTPAGRRFVDAPEVARMFERAVVLTITAEEARELPEPDSGMAWIEPVRLAGAHVLLEPAAEQHLGDLLEAGQDDAVWAWLPWARPRTESDVATMLEAEREVALPFAQVDAASGRAVGITTYRDVDERHRTLEVGGTWLGRQWWRTAINTEAKLLILGHAFETLDANRVAIKTDIRNERSQTAIARLGAVREGVLRHQYVRRDGSLRDSVLYSIVPAEWPAVKSKLQARLAAHA
jgi:RimJ/RimL family protein N-acetyltransferase